MYRFIWTFTLLPFFALGQVKKTGKKKQQKGSGIHRTKTPVLMPPVLQTIAPPVIDNIPTATLTAPRDTTPYEPAKSYEDAFQRIVKQQVGLIILIPNANDKADNIVYSGAFPDSSSVQDYLHRLIEEITYSPRRPVVYLLQGKEVSGGRINKPLLYPAFLFYNSEGTLLGKMEGQKPDPYDIFSRQQSLLADAEIKDLLLLRKRYREGGLDSMGLVEFILMTKRYNSGNAYPGKDFNEYDLLEAFVKKYSGNQSANPELVHLVEKIYADENSIRAISQPLTLHFLINNYEPSDDKKLLWYHAIQNAIYSLHTDAITAQQRHADSLSLSRSSPELTLTPKDAASTQGATLAVAPAPEMVIQLHKIFLGKITRLQMLQEWAGLMQKELDYLNDATNAAQYIKKSLMADAVLFFDSLLHINQGIQYGRGFINQVVDNATPMEIDDLTSQANDPVNFKKEFEITVGLLLNNISWAIFKNDLSNEELSTLLLWSKASMAFEPANPYYSDSYAHLLYEKGEKNEAIQYEIKAINTLQKNKFYEEAKWMKPFIEKELIKMKQGKKLERKEYQ